MSSIKIIFAEKGKNNIIIEAKTETIFSDLINTYFKRACISKKDRPLKKFIFLDKETEIPSSSSQKLEELGIKSLSKIEVKINDKPLECYSLLEERKERDRMEQLKKELLKKEKEMRNPQIIRNEKEEEKEKRRNIQINNVLENMCIYGNVLKKEIKEEKLKNPQKFIVKEEALKSEKKDQELFALALVADALEKNGIETVIEKDEKKNDEEEEGLTCLQYLSNGLNNKIKKYDLHFDFGEEKNNELLNNESEYNNFKEKLKLKISKEYNISVDKIIITFPQKGSVHVQLIFQSEELNNLKPEDLKINLIMIQNLKN